MVCVLTGVAIYFSHLAQPHAITTTAMAKPPCDLRKPALTGAEVRRDALTMRDGRRYRQGETAPFTGVMTEFYASGTLQSRSVLSNGLLEGLSEGWYTNGNKQVEELYRNNVSHGLRVKWYESGQKLSEAPIVSGKIVGVFKRWHENGVLAEEVTMRAGNPDGVVRAYYPSGCRKTEAHLSNGNVLDQKNWPDGDKRSQAPDKSR